MHACMYICSYVCVCVVVCGAQELLRAWASSTCRLRTPIRWRACLSPAEPAQVHTFMCIYTYFLLHTHASIENSNPMAGLSPVETAQVKTFVCVYTYVRLHTHTHTHPLRPRAHKTTLGNCPGSYICMCIYLCSSAHTHTHIH